MQTSKTIEFQRSHKETRGAWRGVMAVFLLLFVPVCRAQRTASNPLGAQLTVQDAGTCSTTNSFADQILPSNAATSTVNLAGTFSGTLTIRLSNNGGASWTTNTTTTTAGTTTVSTNGFTDICADVTTFTSGIFQVTISTGLNTGPQGPAGPAGSGGGNPTTANQVDPTQSPYSVRADAKLGADGSTTNGQALLSSTNTTPSSADIGKLVIAVNQANGAYPFGTGLVTITGTTSASCPNAAATCWTTSHTANVTLTATANWSIGTGNGAGLAAANLAAFNASQILAIPCGPMIVETSPFSNFPVSASMLNQHPDIQGCNSTGGSVFILHPNISGGLGNQNGLFALWSPPNSSTGAINYAGLSVDAKIENLTLTSLSGNIPGGANNLIFWAHGYVRGIQAQGISSASGGWSFISHGTETHLENLSLQNFGVGGANPFIAIQAQSGTGIAWVNHVICAFTGISTCWDASAAASPEMLVFENNYCVQTVQCFKGASGGTHKIVGNDLNANGINVNDVNAAGTYYLFANNAHNATASTAVFNFQNAGTVADISGTICTPATAGFCATGAGTINDRAGNTIPVLSQFTGKYVPIGGGSVTNNTASATTNVGAVLTAVNVLTAVSPAPATFDVKIGFRQATLGVGCGAGSNTVNGVLTWTSGGISQSTGSGGVPALGTLTISANGAVGTSSSYSSQPVRIDGNTQITFTTTSTLASAGCSTIPQYVVDFSTI